MKVRKCPSCNREEMLDVSDYAGGNLLLFWKINKEDNELYGKFPTYECQNCGLLLHFRDDEK